MRHTAAPTLNLVYLARLRETLGTAGEAWPLPEGAPTTVAALLDSLRARGGAWATEFAAGRAFRVAVNHDMAQPGTTILAGDEVAFFPPVTGG